MKRLLAFFLLLAMICAGLTACGKSCSDSGDPSESGNGDVTTTSPGNTGENPDEEHKNISTLLIANATKFSEGMAFIRTVTEIPSLYCIDVSGDVVFKVTNENKNARLDVIEGFRNGVAALDPNSALTPAVLCNTNGEIINPEDVEADAFLINETNETSIAMFRDGYFFAKRTDDNGANVEMAIINSELNIVVDFSERLADLYDAYSHSKYYGGYLFEIPQYGELSYLDLRTGEVGHDFDAVFAELEYESDVYEPLYESYEGYLGYYHPLNGLTVVDLSQYKDTIAELGAFSDGYAYVLLKSGEESEEKTFFAITNENGEFLFEPVELKEGYSEVEVKRSGEYFLVVASAANNYCLMTFDLSGMLGEYEYEVSNVENARIELGDDIVLIHDGTGHGCKVTYLTLDFAEIF